MRSVKRLNRRQEILSYGLYRSELAKLISELVFDEQHRKMCKRRLLDGLTIEKLAEEFEMSVRQTHDICKKHEQEILKWMKDNLSKPVAGEVA